MVGVGPRPLGVRVIAVAVLVVGLGAPASAQLTPVVDVASFSERAAAWSAASALRQTANAERAEELGREAAADEAEQQAAEDAARRAAEAAAREAAQTTTTTTAAPATTVAPTTTAAGDEPAPTTTAAAPTSGPTAEQWAALRACESGGRYDALSPGGRYRGAYQFSQATWDWVASWANPALVGVDPATAAPADQDAQALALYDRQGAGPWPHCGAYLS